MEANVRKLPYKIGLGFSLAFDGSKPEIFNDCIINFILKVISRYTNKIIDYFLVYVNPFNLDLKLT